jgi:hypothetical protein
MVFADTFCFLALLNRKDRMHAAAVTLSDRLQGRILTTEWVLTELADALSAPEDRATCVAFLTGLSRDPDIRIIRSRPDLWAEGFELFAGRKDKPWSLTDCISFVVMRQHNLKDALTGDHHFEQAGFNVLLRP